MTCDFAIIERLDVHDVVDSYQRLYARGRHGAPPDPAMYEWMFDRGPSWVRATVPLDYLDFQTEEESSQERVERARRYAARGTPFPPGTASYGGRSQRRRSGKAYVQDGNHRVLAAHLRGDCAIEMFMPEAEFFAVVEDARWRESGAGEMRESARGAQHTSDLLTLIEVVRARCAADPSWPPERKHICEERLLEPGYGLAKYPLWRLVPLPVPSVAHDPATDADPLTDEYVRQRRSGSPFPPILALPSRKHPGTWWAHDGNHRVAAAKIVGDRFIDAYVPAEESARRVSDEVRAMREAPPEAFTAVGKLDPGERLSVLLGDVRVAVYRWVPDYAENFIRDGDYVLLDPEEGRHYGGPRGKMLTAYVRAADLEYRQGDEFILHRRLREVRETTASEQGPFDKYRSLPEDPDRGSPRAAYGPPSYHLVGDYWTVPVVVPLEDLNSLRATAIDKARLRSVQQARKEGVWLSPIEIGVFQSGSGWIVDGNHRLVAARRAKDDAVEVIFTFV
jgi:hypothetical protein